MHYEIFYSCISHKGNIRSTNQDNFICDKRFMNSDATGVVFPLNGNVISTTPTLFGVFDGLGGEECGEIASFIAAQTASCEINSKDSIAFMKNLCFNANHQICKFMKENLIYSMGTTAAMLLFSKHNITLCNIGDSRIFRISENEMFQVSMDHVSISPFGKKPFLSQNLGIPPEEVVIEPYFSSGDYFNGDKYLICSDGLTDMVSENEICQIICSNSINDSTNLLLQKALENGGRDNVTIILLEVKQKKFSLFK